MVIGLAGSVSAQTEDVVSLSFVPTFDGEAISLYETFYKISEKDSIQFEALKFYVSQIELYNGEALVFAEEKSFHLLDADVPHTLELTLKLPTQLHFTEIKFNLGIDSLTNVSGAYGGDLDPTKGMYWTWQSGYINFKLEGIASNCPARKNQFIYHIGGYLEPYYPLQSVQLTIRDEKKVDIHMAVDEIFEAVDVGEAYHIMSPNEEAMHFSHVLKNIFRVK